MSSALTRRVLDASGLDAHRGEYGESKLSRTRSCNRPCRRAGTALREADGRRPRVLKIAARWGGAQASRAESRRHLRGRLPIASREVGLPEPGGERRFLNRVRPWAGTRSEEHTSELQSPC